MNINDYSADFVAAPFDIGDIVHLASGSPDLTVVDVCDCGSVSVAWYDDHGGMQEVSLPEEVFVYAE